jgi:Transposase IS4
MKDVTFTSLFMSTYGTLEENSRILKKFDSTTGQRVQYKHTEVFANHYKYRSIIDSHNAKRHAPISLETTWATKRWPNRVFAFVLAVTEVNVFLASNYFFKGNHDAMLDFRKKFANAMIDNVYYKQEKAAEVASTPTSPKKRKRKSPRRLFHEYKTLPKNTKFFYGEFAESTMKYPQFKCVGCFRKV